MALPSDPPANVTPAAFKTWAQNVSDSIQALDSATYVQGGSYTVDGTETYELFEVSSSKTAGYIIHLMAGTGMGSAAALIGLGVDQTGIGLFVNNKIAGEGIKIAQNDTITSATAYGLNVSQLSTTAPAVHLGTTAADGRTLQPMLEFQGNTTAVAGKYVKWFDENGTVGDVDIATGQLTWYRNIEQVGNLISARDDNGVGEGFRSHARLSQDGLELYSNTGADGSWWPFRIHRNGSQLNFQTSGASSTVGTFGTANTVMQIKNNQIGFYGAAAVSQQTGVAVTASAIHAALVNLGLITA